MGLPVARLVRYPEDAVDPRAWPAVPVADRILMTEPEFFDVEYVENPHMEGNLGQVDRFRARLQWRELLRAYQRVGLAVDVLPGQPHQPDYVFAANQSLPVPPGLLGTSAAAVLSIMKSARRQPEVKPVGEFLAAQGLMLHQLDPYAVPRFEGTGDAQWHPGRAVLWGGVGPRSTEDAYRRIAAWTGAPVLLLDLVDPRFYHLDTCLALLDEDTAVCFPAAFAEHSLALLRATFPRLLEVDEEEAMRMFCNGHCPDGRHYLVQRGCARAEAALARWGFEVIGLETSEFLKSGGSVFCMKLQFWG